MEQPKKASFGFQKFIVPNFSYKATNEKDSELELIFDPKGEYDEKTGKYFLTLSFQGKAVKSGTQVIHVVSMATFKFSESIKITEIPEYFYANSIAIMFPYVRSFISTLTLQANTGLIMLETLNLSNLKDVLKKNTKPLTKLENGVSQREQ